MRWRFRRRVHDVACSHPGHARRRTASQAAVAWTSLGRAGGAEPASALIRCGDGPAISASAKDANCQGPATPSLRRLDPREDQTTASRRVAPPRRLPADGLRGHHESAGAVARQHERSASSRLLEGPLPRPRTCLHGERWPDLIRRTAVVRTRMPGGVGGVASRDAPYPDWQREHGAMLDQLGDSRFILDHW